MAQATITMTGEEYLEMMELSKKQEERYAAIADGFVVKLTDSKAVVIEGDTYKDADYVRTVLAHIANQCINNQEVMHSLFVNGLYMVDVYQKCFRPSYYYGDTHVYNLKQFSKAFNNAWEETGNRIDKANEEATTED